jgi:hypothetical protein
VVNDIFEEPAGFPGTTPGFTLVSVTRITTTGGTEQLSGNNIGTGQNPVTCTEDSRAGSARGCIIIFHNAPPTSTIASGRMKGDASSTTGDGVDVKVDVDLQCDITLKSKLDIKWKGHHWKVDNPLTSATCIDDPGVSPEPKPAPFDTFNGTGTGDLDGADGSRAEFSFVDAGGKGDTDKAAIKIFDPAGNLVLNVPLGFITHGKLEANFVKPPKPPKDDKEK